MVVVNLLSLSLCLPLHPIMFSVSAVVLCCVVMASRSASCWWHSESQSTQFWFSGYWITPKVMYGLWWPLTCSNLWPLIHSNLWPHVPLPPAGSEEEAQALGKALQLLKDLISSVDQEVLELDRTRRLQEIQARLDPWSQAEVQGGGVFRGGELLRRRLLHEGMLLLKVQGSRMKGKYHLFTCVTCLPVYLCHLFTCITVCIQMFRSCWCQTSLFSFKRKTRSSPLHHWWVTPVYTCSQTGQIL